MQRWAARHVRARAGTVNANAQAKRANANANAKCNAKAEARTDSQAIRCTPDPVSARLHFTDGRYSFG
jgi:hypothetical protein